VDELHIIMGYDDKRDRELFEASAMSQQPTVPDRLRWLLFTVIPGVGYLITAGVVRLLKVDRETMKQIQADLEKRRTNYQELSDYQDLKAAETK
jgi:nicotinamide mononucleotide adenylyltransferase